MVNQSFLSIFKPIVHLMAMVIKFTEISEILTLLNLPEQEEIGSRIKYFFPQYMQDHSHFIAQEGNKIVGILALQKSDPFYGLCYHIEYVSVDASYQNQSLATQLIKEALIFCQQQGAKIKVGSLSDDGSSYVKPVLDRLCPEYGIELIYEKLV